MLAEILEFNQIDPEVLEAEMAARRLLVKFRDITDPLTKKAFKEMVYDALEYKTAVRVRSQARQSAKVLQDLNALEASQN